jgi:hypothetical protein
MQLRQVRDIEYRLLPGADRQTTDIVIERDGLISVRPPKRMTPEQVDSIVLRKRMWIYRNLADWRDLNATRVVREWVNGEAFPYLGSNYRLLLVGKQDEALKLKEGRFCLLRSIVDQGGKDGAHQGSALLPGQAFEAPAVHRAAMVVVVEFAFEAVQHVVHAGEAGGFERVAGIDRAVAAAADQHHGAVVGVAGEFLHFADEMRIDLPVGAVVPGHMQRPRRMADEEEFHLAAAIDEQRLGIVVQNLAVSLGVRCSMATPCSRTPILAQPHPGQGPGRSGIVAA